MTKELEEARKQLKVRDQEILQLRAQVQLAPALRPQSPSVVQIGLSILSLKYTVEKKSSSINWLKFTLKFTFET